MKFKPTILKSIICIIIIILWFFFATINNQCFCKMQSCPQFNIIECPKVLHVQIFSLECHCINLCSCPEATPILDIISQIILLLIPGIILYIIWSLFQNNKTNKKKKR
jgi:hypothetical protein